ncbi:hypothetical protein BDW62DRAFT_198075 [Aspergillus aurantiobrunneus]
MPIKCDSSSATYALLLLVRQIYENYLIPITLLHQVSILSLIFGALSWARTSSSFLPLPPWIPVTATLLPILTSITLFSARVLQFKIPNHLTQPLHLLDSIHTILLATLATLALAYLFPDSILSCHLENQWQAFFQAKNAHVIRAIQDQFQCCGFRSIRDRAYPFKDRTHGDDACEVQYGYRQSCLGPWRGEQQGASWMVFVAVVGALLVKAGFAQLSSRRASWMSSRFLGNRRTAQLISGPELEEGDDGAANEGEARRTLLPHSRSGQENVWDVD